MKPLLLAGWLIALPCLGQVTGQLEEHTLKSDVFDNVRTLRVWLPSEYSDQTEERYPVLYLQDGQNLFDATTSTFSKSEWGVDETLQRLIETRGLEPLIVVGIDHPGKRRRAFEYLPYPDEYLDPPEPDPQGRLYPEFLASEVFPFIESRYRTRPGPSNRILGGSSYGALISLYSVSASPGLAHALLLESPSLYVAERKVLSDLEKSEVALARAYVGIGSNELGVPDCGDHPGNEEAVEDAERLAAFLAERAPAREDVLLVVEECATHGEAAWAGRFERAIRFLTRAGTVPSPSQR